MKKLMSLIAVLLFVCTSHPLAAQDNEGIHFIDQSMDNALQTAKAENKLVFVDSYTTWCSPCKWMADNIFVQDSVAQFYNKHFVNLKMDMEKNKGPHYRKKYNVQVFPTYLFLNAEGKLIHKSASRMEAAEFISEGKRALSPYRSSSVLKEMYKNGDRSLSTLLNYAKVLQKINRQKADSVKNELVNSITEQQLKTSLGWQAISTFATDMNSKLYQFMKNNEAYYRNKYGDSGVDEVIGRGLLRKLYSLSRDTTQQDAFFETLQQLKDLPERKHKVSAAQTELDYYVANNELKNFIKASDFYASTILKKDDATLSFIARRAQRAEDERFVQQAYKLAKQAADINPEEYSNQATLAEICYKLGRKTEAVKAANEAYQISLDDTSKIQKIAKKLLEKTKGM